MLGFQLPRRLPTYRADLPTIAYSDYDNRGIGLDGDGAAVSKRRPEDGEVDPAAGGGRTG